MKCEICIPDVSVDTLTRLKHCGHCHETYKEWLPHIRECEAFQAYWRWETGYDFKLPSKSNK